MIKRRYFCVYILLGRFSRKIYVGYTQNLSRRLRSHRDGKCPSTKDHRPFVLLHFEYFLSKTDALKREAMLKTPKGRKALQFLLAEGIEMVRAPGE